MFYILRPLNKKTKKCAVTPNYNKVQFLGASHVRVK